MSARKDTFICESSLAEMCVRREGCARAPGFIECPHLRAATRELLKAPHNLATATTREFFQYIAHFLNPHARATLQAHNDNQIAHNTSVSRTSVALDFDPQESLLTQLARRGHGVHAPISDALLTPPTIFEIPELRIPSMPRTPQPSFAAQIATFGSRITHAITHPKDAYAAWRLAIERQRQEEMIPLIERSRRNLAAISRAESAHANIFVKKWQAALAALPPQYAVKHQDRYGYTYSYPRGKPLPTNERRVDQKKQNTTNMHDVEKLHVALPDVRPQPRYQRRENGTVLLPLRADVVAMLANAHPISVAHLPPQVSWLTRKGAIEVATVTRMANGNFQLLIAGKPPFAQTVAQMAAAIRDGRVGHTNRHPRAHVGPEQDPPPTTPTPAAQPTPVQLETESIAA